MGLGINFFYVEVLGWYLKRNILINIWKEFSFVYGNSELIYLLGFFIVIYFY